MCLLYARGYWGAGGEWGEGMMSGSAGMVLYNIINVSSQYILMSLSFTQMFHTDIRGRIGVLIAGADSIWAKR